jgi:uncharacterized protein (TIGR02231 family)
VSEVRHFPPIDTSRTVVPVPVREVTLLEDRARVRRWAEVDVVEGTNRLVVLDVAPTLQDVSLAGAIDGEAKVTDLRCRRAMRVWHEDQPEDIARIDTEIEGHRRTLRHLSEDRTRLADRYEQISDIAMKSAEEIPVDAAWGMVNQQAWRENFERLFERMRSMRQETFDVYHHQIDTSEALDNAVLRRQAATTTTRRFVAWVEIDVHATAAGKLRLEVDYVVPSALWRPMHRARLVDGKVAFEMSAVVWQRTGEDWSDVELAFSTARSSLGTEPPLLSDDRLTARRRSEQVEVEARQVRVQRAQVKGGGGPGGAPSARELPGVDDGGDIQVLRADGRHDVPSDGRPTTVPVDAFEAPCEARLVVIAELDTKAFLETVLVNTGSRPILAGPVALVREHGFVGWTETLFVAPGQRFSLSFGPDDAVRVTRTVQEASEVDHVDGWRVDARLVKIFLSNLGGDPKRLAITERIAVSEVEQVRVALLEEDTSHGSSVDDDGFVRWTLDLDPHGRATRQLAWSVAVAPGVEGL